MFKAEGKELEKQVSEQMARALKVAEMTWKKAKMTSPYDEVQAGDDAAKVAIAILATKIFDSLEEQKR